MSPGKGFIFEDVTSAQFPDQLSEESPRSNSEGDLSGHDYIIWTYG